MIFKHQKIILKSHVQQHSCRWYNCFYNAVERHEILRVKLHEHPFEILIPHANLHSIQK